MAPVETNEGPRGNLDQFGWMADITIPYAEPDRALFFWEQDGLLNAHFESWPVSVALSACRFLSHFLTITSYYGNQGLVNASRDDLIAKFSLESEDAWSRCNAGWQIICYGLRDFQGTLSGLLMAHDETIPKLIVLVSGLHYWAIHEAARCFPRAFAKIDEKRFCTVDEALAIAQDFLTALDWENRSLKAFDNILSPYMNLWFVSDIAADYGAEVCR
jgi:hypothetical protein